MRDGVSKGEQLPGRFEFNHVIHYSHSKLSKSNKMAIIFEISDILPYTNVDMKDYVRYDYTNEM